LPHTEANGPDIVNNGIALSGTTRWMFDRGLIALSDDLNICETARHLTPDGLPRELARKIWTSGVGGFSA